MIIRTLLVAALALSGCASTSHTSASVGRQLDLPETAIDFDGNTIDLRSGPAPGRPLVVVFWQTWCKGCVEDAPKLARASRELAGRAAFVGIVPGPDDAVDEAEMRQMIADLEITYPQVRDRDLALFDAFEVGGTPTVIVVGDGGRELWRGHGAPRDWDHVLGR